MAANERTQVKATIRRAMQAAQQATNQLDARALKELEQLYYSALKEVQYLVTYAADELGQVCLSQLQNLSRTIGEVLVQIHLTQSNMVDGYMVEAAKNGGNIFATTMAAEKISQAIDSAVLSLRTIKQSDGLQLSDRLWRAHRGAKERLINTVEQAIIQGNSASDAAQAFQRNRQAIPDEVAKQMAMANSGQLNKRLQDALINDSGASYHQIKRVMRTEINRAHGSAFQNAAFEDEFVVGTQFILSPNHPKRDICDMHANANLYGLGNGVYPQGKSPWPAHPNTLSYEDVVFVDEVTDKDKAEKTDRLSWLKSQNYQTQIAVLGHSKKVSAFRKGHLSQNMIATPWKYVEPALKRKGINTDRL